MHINEIVINYDEIIYELKTHLSETELRPINSRLLYSASKNLDGDSQETFCLLADVGNPNKKTQ